MSARDELLARIGELAESISTAGCMDAKGFAIEGDLTLPQIRGPLCPRFRSGEDYRHLAGAGNGPSQRLEHGGAPGQERSGGARIRPQRQAGRLARLTHAGREVIETLNRSHYEAMEKIAAFLSVEELEVVAQALEVFQRGVERLETASEADRVLQGAN